MFEVLEESNYLGKPVFLYEFSRGSQFWRYTNADRNVSFKFPTSDVSWEDRVFTPLAISDAGVTQSDEPAQDDFSVTMPWTTDVVALFIGTPPSDTVWLRVYRMHYGDPDAQNESLFALGTPNPGAPLSWIGSVRQVKRQDAATAVVTCSTLAQSFNRSGIRLSYCRTCPYMLYDPLTCKADKTAFNVVGTITGLSGVDIIADAFATKDDGYFNGGYIEWTVAEDTLDSRPIEISAGGTISLLGITDGLALGTVVTAYAGCDRLIQTCNDKFDNMLNNGACPQMPGISPFDNNPVFGQV